MASLEARQRADALCSLAEQTKSTDAVKAASFAKEALTIVPDHSEAIGILQSLQQNGSPILHLLDRFTKQNDTDAGREAIAVLKRESSLPSTTADKCITRLIDGEAGLDSCDKDVLDEVTARLLTSSAAARGFLHQRFTKGATAIFEVLWSRGPQSLNALITVIIESMIPLVQSQQAVRDAFTLALGKIIDAGQDHVERAMTAVAKLLATRTSDLKDLIDADTFEIIVPNLDIRLPQGLRSQATLALVKLLEITKDTDGEQHLRKFVTYHVGRGHNEDLIVAFSAAAAAFPILPSAAAALFLSEGFLPSLMPKLEQNSDPHADRKSRKLEYAALDLFSAACIDKSCREAIAKYAYQWLTEVSKPDTNSETAAMAALVLAKISQVEKDQGPHRLDELARILTGMTLDTAADKQNAIEGLVYCSLSPKVKEDIAANKTLLKTLRDTITDKSSQNACYGAINVLANITRYRSAQTEDQKRMAQLKAYANASLPQMDDSLEDDRHVNARCRKVMDAEVVPALLRASASPGTTHLVIQILNSLAKDKGHRGQLVQQGAVPVLLVASMQVEISPSGSSSVVETARTAAHALARIMISTNPAHVFTGRLLPETPIRPLNDLLAIDTEAEQRDLLPVFESLCALTNLASLEDEGVRDAIVKKTWDRVQDLMLNNNPLIQRASVELVCNLMSSPAGAAKLADGSSQANNRMHILLALADAKDIGTRRAAGGGLAILTEWEPAVKAILDKDRGIEMILTMVQDDDDEMKHRGVVCLHNVISVPGNIGKQGLRKIKAANRDQIIGQSLLKTKNAMVQQIGVDVLKKVEAAPAGT